MTALTGVLLAVTVAAMPTRELELELKKPVTLADGATLTFRDCIVESIEASPEDPKSYPAGTGVTFVLELKRGEKTEVVQLVALSSGYASQRTADALGVHLELLSSRGESTPGVRVKVRVSSAAKP